MTDISVKAIKIMHRDLPLYLFGMKAGDILDIAYILPRSRDDPDAIERALDWGRVRQIADFISKPNCYLPGAILVNLDTSNSAIGPFNEDESSAMFKIQKPQHDIEGVTNAVMVAIGNDDPDSQEVAVEVERRLSKFATVIDGQHRLKGLQRSGKLDTTLPVIALKHVDLTKAAKIFADINGEQKPVPPNIIQMIRFEIGAIDDATTERATFIARQLGGRAGSPIAGKVKIYPKDAKTWVPAKSLADILEPIVEPGGPLEGMTADGQTTCIENYFIALQRLWPGAFDDATRKDSILTQPRGFQASMLIFERVWRRCQVYEGGDFSPDAIARQMAPLSVMTWAKTKYGALKGASGPFLLKAKLVKLLPEQDERKAPDYEEVVRWFRRPDLVLT